MSMKKIIDWLDYKTGFYKVRIKVQVWWSFKVLGTLSLVRCIWELSSKYRIWDVQKIDMKNKLGETVKTEHIIFYNI